MKLLTDKNSMQYNDQTVATAERILADDDNTKKLTFQFRWPVRQVGPKCIEVLIPRSDHGYGVLSLTREFIEACQMSITESERLHDKLEDQALRAVAILKD